MPDQALAASRFAWSWCALLTLVWAFIWAAQRRYVLVIGMTGHEWLCVATLLVLFALFQRFIALHAAPRFFMLMVGGIVHLGISRNFSELGQPREGVVVLAALLVGELLGHPLELHRRTTFAQEAVAAGGVPGRAIDAAALQLVHWLTLRFSSRALETAYGSRAFGESYPTFVAVCVGITLLQGLLIVAFPTTLLLNITMIPGTVTLLGVRIWLQRAPDLSRAQEQMGWISFAVWAIICAARTRFVLAAGLSATGFAFISGLVAFGALFLRLTACPAAPRRLILVMLWLSQGCNWPARSEIGQPHEGLIAAAALLIGELLGHPTELRLRLAFAREAVAAGRVPDAAPEPAIAVHPLTLRFANGALESAYAARSFSESWPTLVAACIVLATLFGMMAFAMPRIRAIAACHAFGFLAVLAAGWRLRAAEDQSRAQTRFASSWCALWTLAIATFTVAHRRIVLVSGLSTAEFATLLFVYLVGASFQRLIALPAVHRLMTLGAFCLAHLMMTPSISELGQPREALLVTAVAGLSELLGHPFELRRRLAFAREALAAGRVPDAAPDPAVAVHPLTLRFANGALESVYMERVFSETYPIFVTFSSGGIILCAVAAGTVSGFRYSAASGALMCVVAFCVRTWLSRAANQVLAASRFALSWCALWSLTRMGVWAAHRRYVLVSGVSASGWLCGPVALNLLFALFQRFIALPTVPRFIVLAARVIPFFAFTTPWSELGQPVEGLLVAAAVLVGELLGHPFELQRRTAFAREALAAGRVPDPAPDPAAAVHPLTLRFVNGALESAYAARSFSESWPTLVAACIVLATLFGMMAFAMPRIRAIAACHAFGFLAVLAAGWRLRAAEDQSRAQTRFASSWCALWTLAIATFTVAHRRIVLVSGLSTAEFATLLFVYLVGASFQRLIALPAVHRLMTLGAFCLAHLMMTPSISELGQPREALLVTAVAGLSELLGHPFELRRRLAFAREALAAGRVPDAAPDPAAAVHPLTLRFDNGALESVYGARAFNESYPTVVAFCFGLSAFIVVLSCAVPAHACGSTIIIVLLFVLLRVRTLHRSTNDQASAGSRCAWIACTLVTLTYGSVSLANRLFVLVSGVDASEWLCGPVVGYAIFSMFTRFIALPATPRWLMKAAICLAHLTFPPQSEFDQPVEGLLVVAAVLLGELLGHPFELRRRHAFAREAVAAGRVPDAAPDPAVAVHPLTLRFDNGALEQAYTACTFTEGFSSIVIGCVVFAALFGVMVVALPATWFLGGVGACLALTVFIARAFLHSSDDQAGADLVFAWAWCVLYVLAVISIWSAQGDFGVVTGLTASDFLCLAAFQLLFAIFQCFILHPVAPRLLTLLSLSLAHATVPTPFSDLGQKHEALIIVAALIIGELLCHPFKLLRRVEFADMQRSDEQLATAERQLESYRRDNEELKQLTVAKDTFVASLSHEMRTPLNGIVGLLELARHHLLHLH